MAINPNPETVPSLMERDFGTCVLITDPKSDIILKNFKLHQIYPQLIDILDRVEVKVDLMTTQSG